MKLLHRAKRISHIIDDFFEVNEWIVDLFFKAFISFLCILMLFVLCFGIGQLI